MACTALCASDYVVTSNVSTNLMLKARDGVGAKTNLSLGQPFVLELLLPGTLLFVVAAIAKVAKSFVI